ncbi:hypothetical protein EVJ58_g362 [Rhodofomes roseus]|uniref:C3H1-type domain-containing protein n=1 Tax=Rhodofomes roseus TaxID=34475 RepID=A0A4Y9Z606_9APHY|nr:hypothetical protein EVJ58_g362 [Rhodofomes roseus]
MLHDFPPSHYESDAMFSTFHDGVLTGNDHDCPVSPHSVLDCLPVEVPLKSPPPLQSGFLVWSPKTRGLEFARFSPPVSPHFGGRSRFPSEASTLSTTSTDSSGLYGDASDREDDLEDFVWPPVPPPTPFSFEGAAPENAEAPALPAATTIQFLENPPTPHPYLWRSHKENLYKTKPCKFFFKDRSCIKGDKCNFIHDEWDRAHRTPRPWYERRTPPPARPLSSMGRRHANDATRQPHPTTPRPTDLHMLPKKPAEDAQRVCSPNYYPITWRVIGGGVMMSGRREVCQEFMAGRCHDGIDCKDAHPGAGDDDEDTSFSSLHSYMSPLSPVQEEPAYIPHNSLPAFMLSPASSVRSPVLCSPIMSTVPAQPPVYPEERRRRGRRARKPLTIIPPSAT